RGVFLKGKVVCLLTVIATASHAAIITIETNDPQGVGFRDTTPRDPVGGNPGRTLGQQRLNVFQRAANIWGSVLSSCVPISVAANFSSPRPLKCTPTEQVLGSAGPNGIGAHDLPGLPRNNTLYPPALANSLVGSDLGPATPEITATFNSRIDDGCAF